MELSITKMSPWYPVRTGRGYGMVSQQLCSWCGCAGTQTHTRQCSWHRDLGWPQIALWVKQGPGPGKAGPWGPETGAPHPGSVGWGQGCVKSLEGLQWQKRYQRPQTASNNLEKQSWKDSWRTSKPVVQKIYQFFLTFFFK